MILELFIIIVLFIISLIILCVGLSLIISIFAGAPLVSSKKQVISKALEIARLKKNENLIDLGSGWGQVLKIANNEFNANSLGYEVSPVPFLITRLKRLNVKYQTIIKADVSNADVIYLYLFPNLMLKITPKINQAINNGTRVVSVSFPLPSLIPTKKQRYLGYTIYLYKNNFST